MGPPRSDDGELTPQFLDVSNVLRGRDRSTRPERVRYMSNRGGMVSRIELRKVEKVLRRSRDAVNLCNAHLEPGIQRGSRTRELSKLDSSPDNLRRRSSPAHSPLHLTVLPAATTIGMQIVIVSGQIVVGIQLFLLIR